jgi:hypothetical protein
MGQLQNLQSQRLGNKVVMQWIYQLADKLEKNCKKMLKNYFPGIPLQNVSIKFIMQKRKEV